MAEERGARAAAHVGDDLLVRCRAIARGEQLEELRHGALGDHARGDDDGDEREHLERRDGAEDWWVRGTARWREVRAERSRGKAREREVGASRSACASQQGPQVPQWHKARVERRQARGQ
eukprot:4348117-Prymnesium_polylepis.1